MVEIRSVTNRRELKSFVQFYYDLYRGNAYAVPYLFFDEMATLRHDKNPSFECCEAEYFLAYRDGKIVGRVAAIINRRANERWNCHQVRFGWFDFIDDVEVSTALLKAVEDWGRQRGMSEIAGPLGFIDTDREGMLIDGFNELSTMYVNYNYPYYPQHMEQMEGFKKDNDYVECKVKVPEVVPAKFAKITEMVGLVNDYIKIADLNLVTAVMDGDNMVGFGITFPSFSEAMQKTRDGRLFPFGWWHVLKILKWHKTPLVDLLLIGVLPEYRAKGANALIFDDLIRQFQAYGFEYAITGPQMETNEGVLSQWQYLESIPYRRHRCYRKIL